MMKICFAFLLCTTMLLAQAGHPQNAFSPGQIQWGSPPPMVQPGAQFAVLEGDPTSSSADFTIRTAPALLGTTNPWADSMPAPQPLPEDLAAEGHTIPVARVQAMHEGKRRARARRQ